MPKNNHKYRVSIYLGKKNYEDLEKIASTMNISISSLARIIFDTGNTLSKMLKDFEDVEKNIIMKGENYGGK